MPDFLAASLLIEPDDNIGSNPPTHHSSIEMKQSYIRLIKGRGNCIGRNWEAVPEWFIDRFNRNNGDKSNGGHGKEPATEREASPRELGIQGRGYITQKELDRMTREQALAS